MFFAKKFAYLIKKQYFCIVFFMVLDLRLMKIGLSGDNPSFFLLHRGLGIVAMILHKSVHRTLDDSSQLHMVVPQHFLQHIAIVIGD